ncbi:H-NS histone family protein [Vibrio sp. S9_S30]|uniref:H-NS family histone-like protein n=1 Tax=Vibrio sp. S9_S30 TaxID=2720226 RepID=UPI001680E8BF|nr:H-NS family nucleoid-associated regulatory protein [Vibrio sp. S9_S30]MBD1559787.1 H-NS histone family protein [Vibrio sp. S9_S30]
MAGKLKAEPVADFATEFADVMGRERRMRKYLRDRTSGEVQQMIDKLTKLKQEKVEQEEAIEAQLEEKRRNVIALRELMAEQGLTEADLADPDFVDESTTAKKPRKAKYLYIDANGDRHEWTGKGRAPAIFNDLMKSGVNLDEECLSRKVEERLSKNQEPHPGIEK